MNVLIANLTDAPGKDPIQVDIYNKTLDPGASIKLPADLVDKKIRSLEERGLIAIGSLPPWYIATKTKKGRPLSEKERKNRQVSPSVPVSHKIKESKESIDTKDTNDQKVQFIPRASSKG